MRLTILSSGSSGNTILVEAGGTRVLIDAGLRGRALHARLARAGVAGPLDAAFLTHEHSDHVCGAAELAGQGVALYATRGTADATALPALARAAVRELAGGEPVRCGALELRGVTLPHDAAEPVAYVISDGEVRVGVLTDCGHPAPEVAAAFVGCDALVLETNHDRRMLLGGPYPARLKRRIASDDGHLSNEQAAELLRQVLAGPAPPPRLLICAHLSKTNNHAPLARAALARVLGRRRVQLHVAEQDAPLGPFEIDASSVHAGPQLLLPFAV